MKKLTCVACKSFWKFENYGRDEELFLICDDCKLKYEKLQAEIQGVHTSLLGALRRFSRRHRPAGGWGER